MRYQVFSMGTKNQDGSLNTIGTLIFQFDSPLNICKGDWFHGDSFDIIDNTNDTKPVDERAVYVLNKPETLKLFSYRVEVRELFKGQIYLTVWQHAVRPHSQYPEFFHQL